MAMILSAFASACASKLAALIADRIAMELGVEADVRSMQRRMERVRAVLEDAEHRRVHETGVDVWLDELRDFLYDADDILDLCICRAGNLVEVEDRPRIRTSVNLISLFRKLQYRHEIGGRIRSLNSRFEEICKDGLFLSLVAAKAKEGGADTSRFRSRMSSPLLEANVVGKEIKSATDLLVEMVLREDVKEEISVIAIVGMGGIGKTTLAQRVFNSHRIRNNFPLMAWLCVSREYSEADTVKEAIRCCGGDYGRAQTLAELQLRLRLTVSRRRFLLVLDDVWDARVWMTLLRVSFQGATGKVLVTTRDQSVAVRADSKHIHQVKHLGVDSGRELLYKTACIEGQEEIQDLRDVGMEIVAKCGFLPLTIKVIGGLLITKRKNKAEWERILSSDAWSMTELPEEFKGAIYLSYDDLPSHLKQCFLYLSLFPSDFVYYRWHLCRQWVAEGFITAAGECNAEELAEEYYYQLVTRSILQPHPDYLADQSRCIVHDLLKSFAQHISRKESFSGDIKPVGSRVPSKLRRLSLTNAEEVKIPSNFCTSNSKCLRTLFFIGIRKMENSLLVKFTNLRTLVISDTNISKIPDSIGDLVHLRYLGLEQVNVSVLPDSISRLRNLQFLNLKKCTSLKALPRTLTRICSLHRLGIEETPIRLVPHGIGRLHSLTDLQGFIVTNESSGNISMQQGWTMMELENLSQLRWLRIDNCERALITTVPVLASKQYLKRLELSCTPDSERGPSPWSEKEIEKTEALFEWLLPSSRLEDLLVRGFFGRRFPIWMQASYISNVTWLKLIDCKFCLQLPPLGQLPYLTFLKIVHADSVVAVGPEFLGNGSTAFPKLEYLWIGMMPEWQEWFLHTAQDSVSLFPCLQQLQLKDCPKLLGLPEQLKHAVKMQKLYIQGAHSLKIIGRLPYLSLTLQINGSRSLAMISDLCQIRELYVTDCPSLQCVNNLNALKCLYLDNQTLDCFPEWLSTLIWARDYHNKDGLDLELHCNAHMMARCLKGGRDWAIIEQFSSARVFCKEGSAYMCYNKYPVTYHTNKTYS